MEADVGGEHGGKEQAYDDGVLTFEWIHPEGSWKCRLLSPARHALSLMSVYYS